jgi:sugar phosphate permease
MKNRNFITLLAVVFTVAFTGLTMFSPALADGLGAIGTVVTGAASDADGIKTGIITILGVLATVGIAWAIVSGLRK